MRLGSSQCIQTLRSSNSIPRDFCAGRKRQPVGLGYDGDGLNLRCFIMMLDLIVKQV